MDPFSKANSESKDTSMTNWDSHFEPMITSAVIPHLIPQNTDSSMTSWQANFEPMTTSAVIPQLIPRNTNDLQNVFYKGQTYATTSTTYSFNDHGWDIAPFTSINYNVKDIPSYDQSVVYGNSEFNKNESSWPTQDSTVVQDNLKDSLIPDAAKDITSTSESLIPEISSISSLGLGAVSTIANSALNSSQNTKLELQSKEGTGPFDHSFASENQTQNLVNFNTNVTNLENAAIGVGSLFGVEGLAAGAVAAGAISLASNAFTPSPALVPTNSGNLVDPTNF